MAGPGSRLRWFPLSADIDLHEIHLAPQSSLQVPVGHIPVPGGIKLCSPGTFLVANYLIINNGSFQVNFTKINSATIRSTNSQWLSGTAPEAPVGRAAVPKTGQKPPFATQGWLWGTCRQGGRAKDRPEDSLRHAGMALEYLWAWWPCRSPVGRTLCHAWMALEHLWAWLPCQRPVRRPLRHAVMPLRYLCAWLPCRADCETDHND